MERIKKIATQVLEKYGSVMEKRTALNIDTFVATALDLQRSIQRGNQGVGIDEPIHLTVAVENQIFTLSEVPSEGLILTSHSDQNWTSENWNTALCIVRSEIRAKGNTEQPITISKGASNSLPNSSLR